MINLNEKVIIITGASSGVGEALSICLAKKGSRIIMASRNMQKLEKIREYIKEKVPCKYEPLVYTFDITDSEAVKKLILFTLGKYKRIDILINNAGIGVYGPVEELHIPDIRNVMEVNYFGAVCCTLETLPHLKTNRNGLVVNIASVAGIYGIPFLSAYSASKAALLAFSQSIRSEYEKFGIKILNIYLNYTQTNFFINEKVTGGAVRPPGPYRSPSKVAETIVKKIQSGRKEVVLSVQGKILMYLHAIAPGLVNSCMKSIATRLKVNTIKK